jgi:hypothetical protein
MNIRDISKPVTAKTLNESLAKRFGERIKLEAFTLEQLYDVRNKIRTSLSQVETNESYDAVQTSDTYQKNKLFLDVLNAEISEREDDAGEVHYMSSADANTDSMSKIGPIGNKGANVSKLANYDWKEDILRIAKMLTSPQSSQKDAQIGSQIQRIVPRSSSWKGLRKFLIKNPVDDPRVKSEINKFVAGFNQEVMNAKYESKGKPDFLDLDKDGNKKEPMKKAAKDAKKKKVDEKAESQNQATAARIALKHKKEGTKPKAGTASAEMMKMSMKDLEDFTKVKKGAPKKKNESISSRDFSKHNAIIENYFRHASALFEGEEDKAELVMASKDMVDRVTGWMEDTAEMQTESMLELADAIRDEMGANESEQFISTVKPALESLYAAMEETRASLTQGVGMLTGEVQPETDMGAEDELPAGGDEMEPTTDMEEPADDFEASAPATGGEEEAGREKRESIDLSRRLGTILSSKKK